MAVLARPQLDGSSDVTERLCDFATLPKIGCREWVEASQSITTKSIVHECPLLTSERSVVLRRRLSTSMSGQLFR